MKICTWGDLSLEAPEVAEFGRLRLDGKVAYLATVRHSGMPRTHPVTPIVSDGHCYIFADPDSSKVRDLRGCANFNLHCAMSDSSGSSGEFQISGLAVEINDTNIRQAVESNCSYRPSQRFILLELQPNEAIATSYKGGRPNRRRWQAAAELA